MLIKAKKCPFCGSDRVDIKENILSHSIKESKTVSYARVYCKTCKAEGPKVELPPQRRSIMPYLEEAAELWNARVT